MTTTNWAVDEAATDAAGTVTIGITERPIFIIGSPRSGTTALAAALQRHSALWTAEESQILWDLFAGGRLTRNYQRKGQSEGSWLVRRGVDRETFLSYVGLGINALFTELAGGKRWVDHTPIYTHLVADLAGMFRGAQFLHMLRDGRRVVNSMMHFLSIFDGDAKSVPWARDFREACRTWRRHVELARSFEQEQPHRCLTVRNEELVADPPGGFARIYSFLGIAPEEAPVRFLATTKINSSFGNASRLSVRPESRPWETWSEEQRITFEEEAGATLAACGFS
jgi:hypothetical protein